MDNRINEGAEVWNGLELAVGVESNCSRGGGGVEVAVKVQVEVDIRLLRWRQGREYRWPATGR